MGQVGFRHIDLSGYRLNAEIQEAIEDAGWWTFGTLGIPVNPDESTLQDFSFAVNTDAEEDESYFGPLGFLLLVPLSAGTLAAFALGRAGRAQAALASALPLYVVGLALAYRYNPWIGLHAHAGCADDAARGGRVPLPWSRRPARARRGSHALRHAPAQHDAPDRRGRPAAGLEPRPGLDDRPALPADDRGIRGVDLVIPTDATILALVGENDFVYRSTAPGSSDACTLISGRELGRDRWTNALRLADSAAPTGSSTTAG